MSKMKTNENQDLINDLKVTIENWASEHFCPSGWDSRNSYLDDLHAMEEMENDMLVDDCYMDIADAYVKEITPEQLVEIINKVLAKEATYWLSVTSYEDFDEEDEWYDDEYDDEYDE